MDLSRALLAAALVATACDSSADGVPPVLLVPGADQRAEAIAGDGSFVAYSEPGTPERRFSVVATGGGAPIGLGPASLARFDRTTLLLFRGEEGESVAELLVWRPGDAAPTSIANDVDPGATRFSRDGRWFSTEANDLNGDGVQTVDLLLVDTVDLSVRLVGRLSAARARFTRDSQALVYSGYDPAAPSPDCTFGGDEIRRLPLPDGAAQLVTCRESYMRWELSPDGTWILHGRPTGDLVRTPLTGGTDELLASGLSVVAGKEFDLASDGERLAFLTQSVTPGESVLSSQPFAGGATTELIDSGVAAIIEHRPGILLVTRAEMLVGVAPQGGLVHDLALGARILDETDETLLVLDQMGTLVSVPIPLGAPVILRPSVADAALHPDGRVFFWQVLTHELAVLSLADVAAQTTLLSESGPFVLDPAGHFVVTSTADGLVRLAVPL